MAPEPRVERLDAATSEAQQRRVAGALAARGLTAGDRVAFVLGSSAALISAALGALRSGVIPVMLNPSLLASERALLIEDCQPAVVIDDAPGLASLLADEPTDLAEHPLGRPMHYTSGTTGQPKGVWSGVLGDKDARSLFEDEADQWGLSASDVHLVCSPLYHSAPLRFSAGVLLRGGSVVVVERFEAAAVARAIVDHRPSTAFMVPTHLKRLTTSPSGGPAALDGVDLSSFRLLAHAGEACPEVLKRQMMELWPEGSVWEFYGATEGQFAVCSPQEWTARPGTVGRARAGRRLWTDDGVIWCVAPEFTRFSYWRDEERTAAAWQALPDASSAFSVGDLGRIDEDGYLWVDGRRDDLIITGGVNVYPAEVEAVLAGVDGVDELAVFGVADDRWGQRVCAAFVGTADEASLRQHASQRLAPYKRPKDFYRLDDLPRTGTGKIRRGEVAALIGSDAAGDG